MKLKKFELDQRAINYVYNVLLTKGSTLSKYILSRYNLEQGRIFTILPDTVIEDELYQFTTGGKLSVPQDKIQIIKIKGQTIRIEPLPNISDWLINWLYDYIKNYPNVIAIFENNVRPTYPCVAKFRSRLMIYRNEIYHFLTFWDIKHRYNLIKYTIKEADFFPLRGFLISIEQTTLQKWQRNKVKITNSDIKLLAQNVEKIIVGAYDFESYLIWEKLEYI
ncbi:MAG: hypothetical protein HZLCBSQH_001499 [Candidatus Fervidibacterota bacterium]